MIKKTSIHNYNELKNNVSMLDNMESDTSDDLLTISGDDVEF